jgi:methylglutaconyl-CoA hydratase
MNNGEQTEPTITVALAEGVLTVALNRPDVHNAMSPQLIQDLTALFRGLGQRDDVRVIILTGNGRSFCAGADLASMRAAADYDFTQNLADGQAIVDLMQAVDHCPKPVVGRINGAAIGGGVGLVSCCDIAIAVERAVFSFSEVRLGLIPAVISPYVLAKIGAGYARELFLTAERFDARQAWRIGLIHHVVPEEELEDKVAETVNKLLAGAPGAQAASKELIRTVAGNGEEENRLYTANLIAERRASDEGREGMNAFLEKRKPRWQT